MNKRKKCIIYLLLMVLLMSLFPTTALAANKENEASPITDDMRIDDTINFFKDDELKAITQHSKDIQKDKSTTIFVVVASSDETKNNISEYAIDYARTISTYFDYLIAIDPINRKITIATKSFFSLSIDVDSIVDKYSKADFSKDDFYNGILDTMNGIVDGYDGSESSKETTNSSSSYSSMPTVTLNSYITDNAKLLTDEEKEEIQTNAYKIKNNYDYDIYFLITDDISKYDQNNYAQKVYNDNLSGSSKTILIVMSFENGKYTLVKSTDMNSFDDETAYKTYAKSYFHETPPKYKDGIINFQNAIISTIKNVPITDIEGKTISGTKVNGSLIDYESFKNILKIISLFSVICLVCAIAIYVIKNALITSDKAKKDLINEHPDVAFDKLKDAIKVKEEDLINDKMEESKVDDNINDLYKDVSSEMTKVNLDKTKKDENNIFDTRNASIDTNNTDKSDIIISSINDMIIDVVKKCEGTKEYYSQLQEALNVYNSLSFTNKIQLDRSYTSQLEALARKAKMDKEMSERNSN